MKIPKIVQRSQDTLDPLPLKEDYKALLDLGKSLRDQWVLYLTKGIYFFEGSKREQQETRIQIDPKKYRELIDYSIFYNPLFGIYEIKEGDFSFHNKSGCQIGHFIGGFMINQCSLRFILPQDECIRYIRSFSKSFDIGYEAQGGYIDLCRKHCSEFNFEYNKNFETTCTYTINDTLDCNDRINIFEWHNLDTKITC